jgi:uncharacterized protein YndB with AHSA1/START domain
MQPWGCVKGTATGDGKATIGLRDRIVREVLLPATRDEVWAALTSPELLSRWLGEVVELEPRPGGSVVVRDADGSLRRGLVELAEPGRALALRWRRLEDVAGTLAVGDATRVTFRLEDEDAGTRLAVQEEPATLVASPGPP